MKKSIFSVGEIVEYVRHSDMFLDTDKRTFTIGKIYKIKKILTTNACIFKGIPNTGVFFSQIRHLPKKAKKKPYWVEVENKSLFLVGHNNFRLAKWVYPSVREVRQMARRLAKGLGIEFRQ